MGDVAMTSPVVDQLCTQNPDCNFSFLSTPFFKPFFKAHPNFTFVGTDIKKSGKNIFSIYRLYKELAAAGKYDAVVDIHDVLRTKVLRTLFALSGVKVFVVDKGRREKKALTRKNNKVMKQLKPTVERYADALRSSGLTLTMDGSYPLGKSALSEKVQGITGIKNERWIGVAPFAQHKGKIYPIGRVEQVVDLLIKSENTKVFIFGGGPTEKAIAEEISCRYDNCISIIGKLNLEEELMLISNLDCMMSMDSSAMHMASLSGVRVVSIWGATHPYAGFLGYGQSIDNAVQLDLDCRPCSIYGNKPCYKGTYECMDINPEVVARKILNS